MDKLTVDDQLETHLHLKEILTGILDEQESSNLPPVYVRWLLLSVFFGMIGSYPIDVDLLVRLILYCSSGTSCIIAMFVRLRAKRRLIGRESLSISDRRMKKASLRRVV